MLLASFYMASVGKHILGFAHSGKFRHALHGARQSERISCAVQLHTPLWAVIVPLVTFTIA